MISELVAGSAWMKPPVEGPAEADTGVVAGTAPVFLTSFVTTQGLFLAKVCAAATAISIPVIAGVVAWGTRRMRKKLAAGAKTYRTHYQQPTDAVDRNP